MRLRIKEAKPQTLNDAIRLAVELEAFIRSDTKRVENMSHLRVANSSASPDRSCFNNDEHAGTLRELQSLVKELQSDVKQLRNTLQSRNIEAPRKQRYIPRRLNATIITKKDI